MIHTAGRFDPKKRGLYFIALNPPVLEQIYDVHANILIPINELRRPDILARWTADSSLHILIDSGIFWLTNEYRKKYNVTGNAAMALSPTEIDGFSDLFEAYVHICKTYGDKVWGYIELDQGGKKNKIRIRKRLEKMGLRPIPVYHPIHDGWDYFDFLAENYDRVCIGNIAHSDRFTRLRIIATIDERRKKYPHLWVHLLGYTPNQWLNTFHVDSCDSSTWLAAAVWAGYVEKAGGQSLGPLSRDFQYMLGAEHGSEMDHHKGWRHGVYGAHFVELNWRVARAQAAEYERRSR